MSYFFLQWWGIFENKKVGMRFINHFLETYGFDGVKGFFLSLFPSFKYDIQVPVLTGSALLAVCGTCGGCGDAGCYSGGDVDGHQGEPYKGLSY